MKRETVCGGHYFDKYESRNPLVRIAVSKYLEDLDSLLCDLPFYSFLDCGEGYILEYMRKRGYAAKQFAFDSSKRILDKAKKLNENAKFVCSNMYSTGFKSKSFDVAALCQVLEHLDEPDRALNELKRVSRRFVLITVPHEPYWRIANMLRLRYLKDEGNTPGHIEHFSRKNLKTLLEKYFRNVKIKTSTVFLIALCEI